MSATDLKEIRKFLKSNRVAARPGTYLVDSIPWLKYIPWYGRQLKREFEARKQIYINDLNHVKEQLVCTALPVFKYLYLRLNHLTAGKCGYWPVVREIYARK